VEVDTILPSVFGSISVGISSVVTPGRDRVIVSDVKQVELFAAKRTKLNPRK